MSIKRPTSGGQVRAQKAAVQRTFHLVIISFYLQTAMVRTQCSAYKFVHSCARHRHRLLPSGSEATPHENHLYRHWHKLVPLNCSHYSICTLTSIPCMDQHFQGPADQFSRNFGLMFSNQNFYQTKISMKVPYYETPTKIVQLAFLIKAFYCAVTYFERRVLCWNFFTYQSYPRFTSITNCSCWSKYVIKCLMIWATIKNKPINP